jgi:uncharacterized protein YjbI with pentapeptide repeats
MNKVKSNVGPEDIWVDLFEGLTRTQADLNSATTPPMPFQGRKIQIKNIIKKYYYILLSLPEKEFDLAIRDLYWAAVIEQAKSKSRRSRINAEGAILFEANLSGLNLKRINLKSALLFYSNLTNSSLQGADISKAQLQGANLTEVKLDSANLTAANLQDAKIVDAVLRNANLSGADFRGANLTRADLRGTKCTGANFAFADLSNVDLDGADLADISFNALTKWPNRTKKPAEEALPSSAASSPSAASFEEIKSVLQQEVHNQVPMVSESDT